MIFMNVLKKVITKIGWIGGNPIDELPLNTRDILNENKYVSQTSFFVLIYLYILVFIW